MKIRNVSGIQKIWAFFTGPLVGLLDVREGRWYSFIFPRVLLDAESMYFPVRQHLVANMDRQYVPLRHWP